MQHRTSRVEIPFAPLGWVPPGPLVQLPAHRIARQLIAAAGLDRLRPLIEACEDHGDLQLVVAAQFFRRGMTILEALEYRDFVAAINRIRQAS